MTWKAGDTVTLPIYLEQVDGTALSYANQAAFLAAGWALAWRKDGASIPAPSYTIAQGGPAGKHELTFALPAGVTVIDVTIPAGLRPDWRTMTCVAETHDADSLATIITESTGLPINTTDAASYAFSMVDGDSFRQTVTIPASALTPYGYSDLSDIGGNAWTVSAYGRLGTNPPPATKDFQFTASISSKTNRTVLLVLAAGTSPPTVDYAGGGTSRDYEFDVQLVSPTGAPIACKITAVSGVLTVRRQETDA